jgi:hypothetical protein
VGGRRGLRPRLSPARKFRGAAEIGPCGTRAPVTPAYSVGVSSLRPRVNSTRFLPPREEPQEPQKLLISRGLAWGLDAGFATDGRDPAHLLHLRDALSEGTKW